MSNRLSTRCRYENMRKTTASALCQWHWSNERRKLRYDNLVVQNILLFADISQRDGITRPDCIFVTRGRDTPSSVGLGATYRLVHSRGIGNCYLSKDQRQFIHTCLLFLAFQVCVDLIYICLLTLLIMRRITMHSTQDIVFYTYIEIYVYD